MRPRQASRLRAAVLAEGPAALAHGNRGRATPRRIDGTTLERVVELARSEAYRVPTNSHLAELLAEQTAARSTARNARHPSLRVVAWS